MEAYCFQRREWLAGLQKIGETRWGRTLDRVAGV
jgi:hypothetical protein